MLEYVKLLSANETKGKNMRVVFRGMKCIKMSCWVLLFEHVNRVVYGKRFASANVVIARKYFRRYSIRVQGLLMGKVFREKIESVKSGNVGFDVVYDGAASV